MESRTLRLLLISAPALMLTILTAGYWKELALGENQIFLALMTIFAFGISFAGLFVGFSERKTLKTILALIGHSIVVAFFIIMVVYSTTA